MNIQRLLFGLPLAAALLSQTALADDFEAMAGKWSVKKTNDEGQSYVQTITVKKDKFTFQISGNDGSVVLYAEGDLKLDKLGPFSAAHFVNIRGGVSASDLQDVNEEYAMIYRLDGDTLTVAAGFDKDRESQKPAADVYRRAKAEAATLVIDEIEMAATPQTATWFVFFEAKVGDTVRRYHIPGKGYDKNKVTIPVALQLPKIQAGQKCSFKLQLDDVDDDVSTEEVDNRSTGEFTVNEKSSQSYKPEDNWSYTVRWHLQ